MNNLVCVRECINFICLSKFLILFYIKLDSVILDSVVLDVVVDTSYGLIKIISSSFSFLSSDLFCSLSLYKS